MAVKQSRPNQHETSLPTCADFNFVAVCGPTVGRRPQLNFVVPNGHVSVAFFGVNSAFRESDNVYGVRSERDKAEQTEAEPKRLPFVPNNSVNATYGLETRIWSCYILQCVKAFQ